MRIFSPVLCYFMAGTTILFFPHLVSAQEIETNTYDKAQHLVCMRNGKVVVDREVVFRLRVTKDSISEEYSYRDGRVGGPKGRFRVRPEQVTCSITPVEGPEAEPVYQFEGLNQLSCRDNGRSIIQPVVTDHLIERGTDTAIIYEYRIHNGPPAIQTVMLSPDGANCSIQHIDTDD